MRARSHAIRRLVARLAVVFVVASLTAACTTDSGPEPEQPSGEPDVAAAVQPVAEPPVVLMVEPTAIPTATAVVAKPVATPAALRPVPPEPFFIGNTLGRGMSLRRAPTSADLVKAWPDGTAVEGLGAQQDARGWTWAWVRDPEGNDGWIPTQFLVRSPDEPSAPLPLTPAPAEVSMSMAAPQESGVSSPVTATPTAVVAATAAASPGAAPKPKSEVVGSASRWYTSLGNSLNVVGTVENKGREPVVLKSVALSLLSEAGQTVGALN